jgi:hypothetical protein
MFASVESSYIKDVEVRDFLDTAMEPSENSETHGGTPHKPIHRTGSIHQAITAGNTPGLDAASEEDAKMIVPNLQVVDPLTFLKENFGNYGPLQGGFNMKLKLPHGCPESLMWPRLVSTHHPDSFLG